MSKPAPSGWPIACSRCLPQAVGAELRAPIPFGSPPCLLSGIEMGLYVFKSHIQKSPDLFGVDSEKVRTFFDLP